MNLQLQRLRKQNGYKKQGDFAKELGVPERRYASWERGEAMMSLAQAYECAVLLGCSLDELAGREWPPAGEAQRVRYADPRQASVNASFEHVNDSGKDRIESDASEVAQMPKYQKGMERREGDLLRGAA